MIKKKTTKKKPLIRMSQTTKNLQLTYLMVKNWSFLTQIRYRAKTSPLNHFLSPLLFDILMKFVTDETRQENKSYTDWEEEILLCLFTEVYVENQKESMKTFLKLISYYSKLAEHKVTKQKSTAFLYTWTIRTWN